MPRKLFVLMVITASLTVAPYIVHDGAAASSAISAIPEVSVNESDLSTQLFNKIFGQGWANLSSRIGTGGDGAAGPTLIFSLLGTLNSLCAIAVAWMVIMTLIVGSVGAAYEGKAMAGKHSSPWVPVRFAFAAAAIAPVFAGLNAMQILILAGIGTSVDMANTMWKTGLDYVATYGSINAEVPPGVGQKARALTAGAVRSQALHAYLALQVGCEFETVGAWEDGEDSWIYYYTVPRTCLPGNPHLQKGDLGGFKVKKTDLGNMVEQAKVVDKTRTDALYGMLVAVNPAAVKLGDKGFTKNDYKSVFEAANVYANTISQGLAQVAVHADPNRKQGMDNFVQLAGDKGWFMAGSYYWIVSEANARIVQAMDDDMEYLPAAWDALVSTRVLYRDWDSYVEPNLRELTQALAASPVKTETAVLQAAGGSSSVTNFFSSICEIPARLVAEMAEGRPDALLTYSNAARKVLLGVEAAVGGVVVAKAAASGAKGWTDSLVGKIGSAFSFGAVSAGTEAAKSLMESIFWLVLIVGVPLYLFFATYAFIIPAIPLMTWVSAIVGWIVLSVEAVIAEPLWLVGHSMPEGDGFAGASGRAGYALFLSVLLRPALLVLAMFVCMILMGATGMLIYELFLPFMTANGATFATGNIGLSSAIAMLIVLGTVIAILTWKMFELTTAMPDRIIRWIGQLLANLGDEGRGMGQQAISQAQSQGRELAGRAGGAMAKSREAAKDKADNRTDSGQGQGREENIKKEAPHMVGNVRPDPKSQ